MATASAVLDAEGTFAASSLLSAGEQTASAKLADALQQELQEEGEAASVAAAFVGAMVGGEAAVAAIAGGAGVVAAAAAGVAAGEAAATLTASAIATGPAAPVAVALFAIPEILTALWGASGGYGCCGQPPDPRPWVVMGNGMTVPPSAWMFGKTTMETKAQALARATKQAKAANADSSCNGNSTYEGMLGAYPAPRKGSFQEYAYAVVRGAIEHSAMFKCWPLATVNFVKLLAMCIDSWNAAHVGPTSSIVITLGAGGKSDPLSFAVGQAVPADGSKTVPTGQTSGFTEKTIPTWHGQESKRVTLKVNTGPAKSKTTAAPRLKTIKMKAPAPSKPAAGASAGPAMRSFAGLLPIKMKPPTPAAAAHAQLGPTSALSAKAPVHALPLAVGGVAGALAGAALFGGPLAFVVGAGLGALAGRLIGKHA